jgi:small subunit ribosomal protein S7
MPRKKKDFTRKLNPDPKYKEIILTKMVSALCKHGKKSVAENSLYLALSQIEKKLSADPLEVFKKAIANVRPIVEVRSRRVGGANYQVPTEVRAVRSQALAIRWLVDSSNDRGERRLAERLANEIMEASQNRGGAIKKKDDTHRMAEANKAFAHFKW